MVVFHPNSSYVYDPAGLIAFAILPAKLILQNAFHRELGWDQELPEDLKVGITHWIENLRTLQQCRILRPYHDKIMSPICHRQLHLFSLASEAAYGSMCFLRNEHED